MIDSTLELFENNKKEEFKQNNKLNDLLKELKNLLQPAHKIKEKEFKEPLWPVGFIIGNTRSGTTIITQWLASLQCFSYPSNLLTRFAYAPYIGALIQKMLFERDFDFHGDFADIQSEINFDSNLGKSKGALAVNEFQHFFRNYMKNVDPSYLNNKEIDSVDFTGIKKGLASIEFAFDKPFIMKAAMLKYNIDALNKHVKSIFIYIKRDPLFNMQSLYLARQKYYQNENIWYGSKPKEYEELKKMDIYHQIAGQVFYTDKNIQNRLNEISSNKQIHLQYEDFCKNPQYYYKILVEKYQKNGLDLQREYKGPLKFQNTNKQTLSANHINKLKEAFNFFEKK